MTSNKSISAPYIHTPNSINKMMYQVMFALIPGVVATTWMFGWGVLIHCILAVIFALAIEFIMLKLRQQPLDMFIFDGSAVVTGLLFALAITPFAPWWVNLSGICFAVIAAKHLYGGLGYNIFNPAMAGYAFVLICFPAELSHWPADGIGGNLINDLQILFAYPHAQAIDGLSGATPITLTKLQINAMSMLSEIPDPSLFGTTGNAGWGWINTAFLIGGGWLIIKGIIKWQIPLIMLTALLLVSAGFHIYDPDIYTSPAFNLLTGGTVLAAFFIATDPVTSPTTPYGKVVYAAGIAVLIYIIRTWGAYPDGIAFAILVMNAMVPLIDKLTRPKIFGKTTA